MEKNYTPFEELNVFDGFMFNELTNQEDKEKAADFCRIILEPIVNRRIQKVEVVCQKIIQGTNQKHHGIRMDAYIHEYPDENVKENGVDVVIEPTIYDIEPNSYIEPYVGKRSRYYHSMIDKQFLESGMKYDKLENTYVIFILNYDPFNRNRMLYTIKNSCVEEPDMPYEDGARTIFLYVYGKKNIPSKRLKDMLLFLVDSKDCNATDEGLVRMNNMMKSIKLNKKVGEHYMHTMMRESDLRAMGHEEGLEKGFSQGRQETLVDLVKDGLISIADAAKKLNISESDFKKLI